MSYFTPKKVVMTFFSLALMLAACLPYDNGNTLMTATVGTEPPDTATATEILPSETETTTPAQTATVDNATLPASPTPTLTQTNTPTSPPDVETATVPSATTQAAPAPTATLTVAPTEIVFVPSFQEVAIVGDGIVYNPQFLPEYPERPCAYNDWTSLEAASCVGANLVVNPRVVIVAVGANDWRLAETLASGNDPLYDSVVQRYSWELKQTIRAFPNAKVFVIELPSVVDSRFDDALFQAVDETKATLVRLPAGIAYVNATSPDPVALSVLVRPYILKEFEPTEVPQPTATPVVEPTPTRIPGSSTPNPVADGGLIVNGSFEVNNYSVLGNGPSGLLPEGWRIYYTSGQLTYCDFPGNQGNCYYTFPPELVPKSIFDLPEVDRQFVYAGNTAMKLFGGWKPIRASFVTPVELQPGVYTLTFAVAPDNCNDDETGSCNVGAKVYPSATSWGADGPVKWNEISQVRALPDGKWFDATVVEYGKYSIITHTFLVTTAAEVEVGVEVYGPVGVTNNAWFLDNFILLPASAELYTVRPGDGWIVIAARTCNTSDWEKVRLFSGHTGSLQPGQVLEIYCP